MKKEDTQEVEPVESLEDVISDAYDSAIEEEPTEVVEDTEEVEEAEEAEDTEEVTESEETEEVEEVEETEETDEEEEPEEKLSPPDHWSAIHKEQFNNMPVEAQKFIDERHKAMEGDYTRKMQEFAPNKRQFEAITDALEPTRTEWQSAGLDYAGAVRQLASWDTALRSEGKNAVLRLAQTYGIDLSESEEVNSDPHVQKLEQKLAQLEQARTRETQEAQQEKQNKLLSEIQSFESETDETGTLKHPHFLTLKDDMTRLFNAGISKDLNDAYTKALALRPDLAVSEKPAKIETKKEDPIQKVRKAKKAATGVKSSGVGKLNRDSLSLRDEIASHFT